MMRNELDPACLKTYSSFLNVTELAPSLLLALLIIPVITLIQCLPEMSGSTISHSRRQQMRLVQTRTPQVGILETTPCDSIALTLTLNWKSTIQLAKSS
jgi:hypothetical protein